MNKEFQFFVPIDVTKSVASSDESWVFEGIASTADVDLFGEVVYPESFAQTIEFFKSNGKIYFDHDYAKKDGDNWLEKYGFSKDEILSLKTPIGKPIDARITPEGLYIKAILNKKHPMARKMWDEFLNNDDKEFHNQIGLSIGAKYLGSPRREYDVKKGKYITYLPELLLYEVSMTPEPVNPYTSSWASVLKSMMSDAEGEAQAEVQYHTISPDSVLFDQENGRLVIKSTVESGDGTTHVFESYINVKEDIRQAMAQDIKVVLKAAPPGLEEKEEEKETSAAPTPPVAEEAPAGAPEGAPEGAPAGEAPPFGGEGAEGEEGGMMAEMGAGAAAEEGAGGILDSLVASEEGEEVSAMGDEGDDASIQMLLDKVDTLIDLVMSLADTSQSEEMIEEAPLQNQVDTQPPVTTSTLKSMISEALSEIDTTKSLDDITVNLSSESTAQFGEALKSVFAEMKDSIVTEIVERLTTETTVVQKSVTYSNESPRIVHPGATVTGDETEDAAAVNVLKAVTDDGQESPLDRTVLKSFVNSYREIIGHSGAQAQKRARVVEEAQKTLKLSEPEFRHFVKMADKGKL